MQPGRYLIAAMIAVAAAGVQTRGAAQSASQEPANHGSHHDHDSQRAMAEHQDHASAGVAVTFADLQQTAERLAAARHATEKYQDVRVAEAAGYRAIGPDVPGMGIHYVREADQRQFSITEPPILLYEPDAAVAGGLRLVGVSYLLVAPSGADGQPADPPFPKVLASWHKHNNICVLPDNSTSVNMSEAQCTSKHGRFTAETSWMVHAWIWKDSPAGVFSPTNPLVK